ncbi:MAG TPA: hypothetical protein VFV33_26870 [Gemmatimonadaceae bacterium]|nr:hypothetical protein [Gemmatimonadaceae bacterium]
MSRTPLAAEPWHAGRGAFLGWSLLALVGQGASLALVTAGKGVGYQHYLPIAQLSSRPLALGVVVAQALLMAYGLRGAFGDLLARLGRLLPGWRLPLLVLATVACSAVVGRDLARLAGELAFSTLVQVVNVGTVVLAARALPVSALEGGRAWLLRLLGPDLPPDEEARPRLDRFTLLAALAATAISAILALVVYRRHPHLQDEVAYLIQARTFAAGKLALANPPVPKAFEFFLLDMSPKGWYSPVPPGWALGMVPGVWLGAVWLVNPVLTGINVALTALVLRPMYGQRVARLATLLLVLSPWSAFLGMGYMPHAITLCCGLLAALGVVTARRTGQARWTWLGGLALGFVASVRQLDAMILALALGFWSIGLGGRRLRIPAVAGLVLGSIVAAIPLLAYNTYFTGKGSYFPMMAYNDALFGKGANDYGFGPTRGMGWALDPNPGHGPLDATINTTLNLAATQVDLFGWSIGSLLLVFVFVLRGRLTRSDRAMLGVVFLTWFAYFFNYFAGGPDFGARYWYVMIVPLCALTARAALTVAKPGEAATDHTRAHDVDHGDARVLAGVALVTLAAWLTFVPWRSVDKYWHYRGMREDIVRVARAREFGRALVLVRGREIPDYGSALAYNPLDLSAPVPVYARRTTPATDSAVIAAFPDRTVWFVDGPSVTKESYRVTAGPLPPDEALRRLGEAPPAR